eukprot:CAMPEP_0194167190 /NCGR_PEP_ID=MMETSP0154-20130528/2552_1 /TAXON_ID=1049557 /ORGANISM="Thalassiothrix antarctica, Strain L6-D1" /LENGTH=226 /DNA_ID=CAMNT_0038878035 /DNA_START=35 /DNA_END=715 /DNA_ORIENTATION=+
MMMFLPVLLIVACLFNNVNAANSNGNIEGVLLAPNSESPLLNSTKISLNDGDRITYSKATDGSFVFYDVPPGIHLLDVHSHTFQYSQVKIQMLSEDEIVDSKDDDEGDQQSPRCIEYIYPGAPKRVAGYPLKLKPHATYQYFEKKKGFSVLSILSNPMALMMVFSMGMMFLMPKLMEGMDPEERAQMQKQMQAQQDPSKMLSNLWSDISSGGKDEKSSTKLLKNKK